MHKRKDGTTFQAACAIVPLANERGTVTHYVWTERDITEELKMRGQLIAIDSAPRTRFREQLLCTLEAAARIGDRANFLLRH